MDTERFHMSTIELGVCYYPEQWPVELWADDLQRMRALGFTTVRVGEFAWSIFEPEEGSFSFALFDHFFDLAYQTGLHVILGTPTATPPAWLTYTYPEVLNVSQDGVTYQHGMRRHYNYTAPIYHQLCERIVRQLAEHYTPHPALVGWQIDNELNCEINVFYADSDHRAFRSWLQQRYGTLQCLNQAWGTVFWNQTYTAWEQIFLTRPTPSHSPNPHQALDEKRFISSAVITFARIQTQAIRAFDTVHWITTNGVFGHLDSHQLREEALDVLSYDSYPQLSQLWHDPQEEPLQDRRWSWYLSMVRNVSSHFAIMEQQAGASGWVNRLAVPEPKSGQIRLWTYQSIAHGADLVLYFRWRTASYGSEIYWHGLHNYDNRPLRRVDEVRNVSHELERVGTAIAGTRYLAEIAILKDYDNEWDGELDIWHGPYEKQSIESWFKGLQYNHIPCDAFFLRPTTSLQELARYRFLIYPHAAILSEQTALLLQSYVEQGGTLVFGCRTGYKDADGHCPMRPMPGPIADLCGITIEDFTRTPLDQSGPLLTWSQYSKPVGTIAFIEALTQEHTEVEILATYAEDAEDYAGKPALTRRQVGKGQVYYYGSVFTPDSVDALIGEMALKSPLATKVELSRSIEIAQRVSEDGTSLFFLLNYAAQPQTIHLHQPAINLLNGETIEQTTMLAKYDVMILRFS